MKPSRPRIKVCCIASRQEAELAAAHGAAAIGLVSEMPSGPGPIPEPLIAEIAREAPAGVQTWLLTSHSEPDLIVRQHRRCGTTAIQLCGETPLVTLRALRRMAPQVALVQVLHVQGPEAVDEAVRLAPLVDALLLDSGRPRAGVPELGGTGRVHDWTVSREIVRRVEAPVWLAGGLRPGNVGEAIRQVHPYGVDACSGLRSGGRLDPEILASWFQAIDEATR